jgi:hypothetical protein
MAIELTPEQQQAVLAHPDAPIDFVDPTTRRAYVLVAREQYDRLRPLLPAPPEPREPGPVAPAVPQCLADLPTPPEVAAAARESYAQRWRWGGKSLATVEEELKLQFYFGGLCVDYLRTPRGIVVLAAGRCGTSEYQKQLDAIPPDLRPRVIVMIPPRWNDEVGQIPSAYYHEG